VFRIYTGGKLLGDFIGGDNTDGYYPEEWVASAVAALNRDAGPNDGISVIRGTDVLLTDLLAAERERVLGDRKEFGVLIKYLDSAVRLPVQAHPDKAYSRRHLNSDYGKTEVWLVLGTREGAGIYFGFNREITMEELRKAVEASDTDREAMAGLMQFVPVQAGDLYFVPAGMPHAICAGCLILEVQEPTDFTIQPEAWCAEYQLNEYEKYLGLPPETAWECFDFSAWGERAIARGKKTPTTVTDTGGWRLEVLIGPDDTDCFGMRRHTVNAGRSGALAAPAIYVVIGGAGTLRMGEKAWEVRRGDYFCLPYSTDGKCAISAEGEVVFLECLPPIK